MRRSDRGADAAGAAGVSRLAPDGALALASGKDLDDLIADRRAGKQNPQENDSIAFADTMNLLKMLETMMELVLLVAPQQVLRLVEVQAED